MPVIATLRVFRLLPILFLLGAMPAAADALDDILERGTLRVGVAEFVPWTVRTKRGELVGFEIDIAQKIADDMGVTADIRQYDWDDIIAALQRGEIDVIAGGMAITPARALEVNFSRPVATSGVGIVANTKMTRDIETLADLNKKNITIVTVADTMSAGVAERLFPDANVEVFAEPEAAAAEILDGKAHAIITSMPEARFMVLRNPDRLDLPVSEPLLASSEALAVRKGEQEWLNFLDAWVTARKSDKWISTSRDFWFGTLDWLPIVNGE
jgi:polar amino acid transport system substrate-binding protein